MRDTGSECLLVPGGGLMAHKVLGGGHTLAKHVGKTEAYLRHRLATEATIKAASSFYDRQIAESAISRMFEEHGVTLSRWLAGTARTLPPESRTLQPVGVIPRASGTLVHANGMKMIIKRSSSMPVGFRIHTAVVIE